MHRKGHFLLQVAHFFYLYLEAKVPVLHSVWETQTILRTHDHQENHCLKNVIGLSLNSAYSIHFVKNDVIKHWLLRQNHLELVQSPYRYGLETKSLTCCKLPLLYTVYCEVIKQLLNQYGYYSFSPQYNLT